MIDKIKEIIRVASLAASINTGEEGIVIGIDTIATKLGITTDLAENLIENMLNNSLLSAKITKFNGKTRVKYSVKTAFKEAIKSIKGLPVEYLYNLSFISSQKAKIHKEKIDQKNKEEQERRQAIEDKYNF